MKQKIFVDLVDKKIKWRLGYHHCSTFYMFVQLKSIYRKQTKL